MEEKIVNNASMQLKNVNPNGDNVVTSNLMNINIILLKIVKIEFKMNSVCYFF
jgi:hypothetical protein